METSKIEQGARASAWFPLSNVIDDVIDDLRQELGGRNISVVRDIDESIRLHGDEMQCHSIVQNLVSNARDALLRRRTGSGGGRGTRQELRGYAVQEEVYASEHTRILRARRHQDGTSVIFKIPSTDSPSLKDIARVRHEHDTLRRFDHHAVIRAHSIERSDNLVFLTLEDVGGIQLKEHFASGEIPLDEFLRLAIAVAAGLSVVHSHDVIHKDLNPRNILVSPGTRQIKIIDFGIAAHLSREVQQSRSSDRLEGTLAYMSPEQTGRIHRALATARLASTCSAISTPPARSSRTRSLTPTPAWTRRTCT